MVEVFLTEILCWESELPGLYGHTNGYYATVEQQGRLTLHLHALIWIRNASTPQEIRDRIMGGDSVFQRKSMEYLESAQQGDFLYDSMADVRQRVKVDPDLTPEEEDLQSGPTYQVPTQTLPSIPPPFCDRSHGNISCIKCQDLESWWQRYEYKVDDLLLRSNVHKCGESTRCLSKAGICKARFPRETFETTHVDTDEHINIKKREPQLNNFSRVLTYFYA
ncbi:hypothetical protein B0H14DRAFT_2344640 [Mycena olivaceomarginata]|nr:hypothetical protein B0H14DRAFT_2344640 [Mycena olivaceomarginata]